MMILKGLVWGSVIASGVLSFVGLVSAIDYPKLGLSSFVGFIILMGGLMGLGMSL